MKNAFFNAVRNFSSRILGDLTGYERCYHCTFSEELVNTGKFFPLTHFGSLPAAKQRLSGAKEAKKASGVGHIMEVQLDLDTPLTLPDIGGGHGLATWRTMLERADAVDIPQGILNNIFIKPTRNSLTDLKEELGNHKLFNPDNIPDINPYGNLNEQEKAAACVTVQRLIRTLESYGFDSVKYTNMHEDRGHTSYVVFRPEKQVAKVIKTFASSDAAIMGNAGEQAAP